MDIVWLCDLVDHKVDRTLCSRLCVLGLETGHFDAIDWYYILGYYGTKDIADDFENHAPKDVVNDSENHADC